MQDELNPVQAQATKKPYVTPRTQAHDPRKVVRGSGGSSSSLYSSGLYTECSLYYYY